jgi:hypothetical protein
VHQGRLLIKRDNNVVEEVVYDDNFTNAQERKFYPTKCLELFKHCLYSMKVRVYQITLNY